MIKGGEWLAEQLDTLCPYYLSIGMSYQDYWYGEPKMARFYIEKANKDMERKNKEAWLTGLYVYKAISCLYPILNPMAKDPTPIPYLSEPLPLTTDDAEKLRQKEEERKAQESKDYMMAKMLSINAKRKKDG